MATLEVTRQATAALLGFPINRRHQRMATVIDLGDPQVLHISFQSIGVTKEWRPPSRWCSMKPRATRRFPINRRHQRMATWGGRPNATRYDMGSFQSIGVTKEWRPFKGRLVSGDGCMWFPINRRHQRMATLPLLPASLAASESTCFQSIGVTKEWRR